MNKVERGSHTRLCLGVGDHWEKETGYRATIFGGTEPGRNGMDLGSPSLDVAPYFSCSQRGGGHMTLELAAEAVAH